MRRSFLERRWLIPFLIGCVVILVGVVIGTIQAPKASTILISVGSSIAAAAVVMAIYPASEELYERLLAWLELNKKFLSLGIKHVYPSRDKVPKEEWVKRLRQAERSCTLLGIAHGGWCEDTNFESAVIDRLERGVEIQILFLDPTSDAAKVRALEEQQSVYRPRDTRVAIRKSIAEIWKLRKKLETERPKLKDKLRVYVYSATPSSGLLLLDNFMAVAHYLAGYPNLTSPTLFVERTVFRDEASELFGMYAENVERIKRLGSTVQLTDQNIEKYVEQQDPTSTGGEGVKKRR